MISSNPSQFIREIDGSRKGLMSPVAELERKKFYLKEWLNSRKVDLPISGVVAFAYANELTITNQCETKIMFAYEIPSYLDR